VEELCALLSHSSFICNSASRSSCQWFWFVSKQNAMEACKSRVINYVGEFEPVKWKCRAPLPSGKLCERMDRLKVSYHCLVLMRHIFIVTGKNWPVYNRKGDLES